MRVVLYPYQLTYQKRHRRGGPEIFFILSRATLSLRREVPTGVLGPIDDAYFRFVSDAPGLRA